jgi:hypothetical protein
MRDLDRASVFAVVAVLGLGLLPAACADQANPVLPPSGGGGGKIVGIGASDAAVGEVSWLADAEDAYVAPDVQLATCDMLRQDCPKSPITGTPQGCYRISGGAHCAPAGDLLHGTNSCVSDVDCRPGLVCAKSTDTGGDCQTICDPDAGAYECPDFFICTRMAPTGPMSRFGYCAPMPS